MLRALLLLLAVAEGRAPCSSWCNAYTTTAASCASCSITAEVDGGTYCAVWCNSYTCSSQYCDGCTFYPCDPCNFQGSFAYEPEKIPHDLLEIMSHDPNIVQPNGCNECPTHGDQPVWIAPGDICDLAADGFSTAHFDHCDTQYEKDYNPSNHVKACLTEKQRDHLWETGHCHDTETTLPFVRKEGLLFCKEDESPPPPPPRPPCGGNCAVDNGYYYTASSGCTGGGTCAGATSDECKPEVDLTVKSCLCGSYHTSYGGCESCKDCTPTTRCLCLACRNHAC